MEEVSPGSGKFERSLDQYTEHQLNSAIEDVDYDETPQLKFDGEPENTAGLGVLVFNIYRILTRHYKRSGLEGQAIWGRANMHARMIASSMEKAAYIAPDGQANGLSVLEQLEQFEKQKKIGALQLDQNFKLSFLDSSGRQLTYISPRELRKTGVMGLGMSERNPVSDSVTKTLEKEMQEDGVFPPLKVPRIGSSRVKRKISILDGMRAASLADNPPRVIQESSRHLAVCSGYALGLLKEEMGEEAFRDSGLEKWGRFPNAWNIKADGAKYGTVKSEASLMDTLDQKTYGRSKDRFFIKNKTDYQKGVADFYDLVDEGKSPALLTAFQTQTKFLEQILKANKGRPEDQKSYNSHVLVLLGREPERSETVNSYTYLTHFFEKKLKIKRDFLPNLKIRIQRKNGEIEEVADAINGVTLRKGDEVFWQDVLVTDFIDGQERILGLSALASDPNMILMEYLSVKGLEKRDNKYRTTSVVQVLPVTMAGSVSSQLKQKLGLSDSDFAYYSVALANVGIDLNVVKPQDILPVFDMKEVREKVDQSGGLRGLQHEIVAENMDTYQQAHPGEYLLPIKSGDSVWMLVEPLFGNYFKGRYELTGQERAWISQAVDESCPNISLDEKTMRFEAGEMLYLTQKRVEEIVDYIYARQAEQFSDNDYVAIIKSGDLASKFAEQCYEEFRKGIGFELSFGQLDALEKSYLLKGLDYCSNDIDLTLVGQKGREHFKNFRVGERMVYHFGDLQKTVSLIATKRDSQKATKSPSPIMTQSVVGGSEGEYAAVGGDKVLAARRRIVEKDIETQTPAPIANLINEVYAGNNIDDLVVRNLLHYAYLNEQGRGGLRQMGKLLASEVLGVDLKSIGIMQLRPTENDLEGCRAMFEKHGLPRVNSLEELRNLVEDNDKASIILAGQRLIELVRIFDVFSDLTGEKPDPTNLDYAIQILTSYNRSPGAVYRATSQVWAIKLCEAAGLKADVKTKEIDALVNEPGSLRKLNDHVISSLQKLAVELVAKGEIVLGKNYQDDINKVFSDKMLFLKSDTFKKIAAWYEAKTGKKLSFILSEADRAMGDSIFSYGTRLFKKEPDDWSETFAAPERLTETLAIMRGEYQPAEFLPEKRPSVVQNIADFKEASEEKQLPKEVLDCVEEGTKNVITFYGEESVRLSLRANPRGANKTMLYFGSKLEVLGFKKVGTETWLEVKVIAGDKAGESGYVGFEKAWFDNSNGPTLHPGLMEKIERAKKSTRHPIPEDYELAMKKYLKFIKNLNPEEVEGSRERMALSRPTVSVVTIQERREALMQLMRESGYTDQKFFGILPKKDVRGAKTGGVRIPGQQLYLYDKENDRFLAFRVSTAKNLPSTPDGKYETDSGTGFIALDKFGAHMGSYRKKYGGPGHVKAFDQKTSGEGASMTTGLIGIRLQNDTKKSRGLYFHGTNRENQLGSAASSGCVRMSNLDEVYLASLLNGAKLDFQVLTEL